MHREQKEIRADLAEAQRAYVEAQASLPADQCRHLALRVKALQAELSAALSPGAVPCSRCKAAPVGLRHVRGVAGRVSQVRHVYEIGCVGCVDTPKDDRRGFGETPARETGPELEEFDARAVEDAVRMWNTKNQKVGA